MRTGVLKPEFTPGPWRECGKDRGGCGCGQVWSVPVDFEVAECHTTNEENGTTISKEQVIANARLIAAAPEMFELLRAGLEDGEPMNWDKVSDLLYSITGQK